MTMTTICAVSVPYPGVLQVLRHGHRLKFWDLVVLGGDRFIPLADVYLLGAWHPVYDDLLRAPSQARFAVLWTSSSGEVGFEPTEQDALAQLLADKRVGKVWFGHRPLAEAVASEKGFYAPYPFDMASMTGPVVPLERERTMTLFAPPTLKKNAFNNLLAASLVQKLAQDHPVLETNMPVPAFFDGRLKYRKYDWLPDEKYRPLIAASSLNFACSWAETLNYQSLEAGFYGVPSVGSPAVPWLPRWAQARPDDPIDIAKTALVVRDAGAERFRSIAQEWAASANRELAEAVRQHLLS